MTKALSPKAYEWHSKPKGTSRERCAICGIGVVRRGLHRAFRPEEGKEATHVARDSKGIDHEILRRPAGPSPGPLLEFYVKRFRPTAAMVCKRKTLKHYITTIHRLERCLARPATLDDLNAKTFARLGEWLASEGFKPDSIASTKTRLRTLWRFASSEKVVAIPPAKKQYKSALPWESESPAERSLRWFFATHYRPLKLRSRSDNTARLYDHTMRNFSRFLGRDAMLEDLTDDTVSRLLSWIIDRGRSPHTAEKERCQLLAIWRFACRKKFLDEWPDVDSCKRPTRIPRAWTQADLVKR